MSFQELKGLYNSKQSQFTELKMKLSGFSGRRDNINKMLFSANERMVKIDSCVGLNNQIVGLFQAVSDSAQSQIGKIELICSDALGEILGDPDIKFKIKTEKKKGGLETHFLINDKKLGDINLMKGEAGAVKNIISVGLRLLFVELYSPKLEGPILLDEVGSNISVSFQESFGKFLKKFSELTGRQIILVTHHAPVIAEATTKIVLSKTGTKSVLEI